MVSEWFLLGDAHSLRQSFLRDEHDNVDHMNDDAVFTKLHVFCSAWYLFSISMHYVMNDILHSKSRWFLVALTLDACFPCLHVLSLFDLPVFFDTARLQRFPSLRCARASWICFLWLLCAFLVMALLCSLNIFLACRFLLVSQIFHRHRCGAFCWHLANLTPAC